MTKKERIAEAAEAAAVRDAAEKAAEETNVIYCIAHYACKKAANKNDTAAYYEARDHFNKVAKEAAEAYKAATEANKVWFAFLHDCAKRGLN